MSQRLRQGIERQSKKLAQVARHQALGEIFNEEGEQQDEGAVDEALAAFGLVAERQVEPPETIYLWPENVATWNLFQSVGTQWVEGPTGPGINFASLKIAMGFMRIKRRDDPEVFGEIKAMERATVLAWEERKKQ